MAEYRKVADSTYHLLVGSTLFGRSLIDWLQEAVDQSPYGHVDIDAVMAEMPQRPLYEKAGGDS